MLWPLVLLLCNPATSIEFPEGLQQPPEFKEQPEKKIVVFPNDEVTLKCEATGNPPVMFRWTKDGKKFDPHGMPGITQRKGSGTLIITTNGNVDTSFKGTYQCYASNILGSAMSSESEIIAESAPQWPKEKVAPITAEEGTSTVLPCNPPTSAVPPKIYWLNSKIEHITQDERVTMGQDGNLYFANVQMTDSRPDYICNAHFQGPRIIIQKEPIELKVIATNTLSHQKPILIVPNKKHSTYMALLGEPLVLECIVAGFPTPTVEWAHMNRLKLSPQVVFENSNKTLRILNVTEDDDGEYQCIAHNEHGTIRHTYTVTVEAAPYWIQKPVSQINAPGENERMDCKVAGKPKPKVSWRINGIPLEDPRRKVQGGALFLSNVQPNDTAVIQCEAHNHHGSLLANAYILIVRLPAEILTPDELVYSVVENQTAILQCMAFGAPRPTVKWFMEDMYPALDDERIFMFTNGTLVLDQVQREDAGNFTCMAANDQNNVSITARLIVKGATQFEVGPANTEEKRGKSVTFHCKVLFDETIPEHGIQWRHNGHAIQESEDDSKYFINETSLTVTNLNYSDQGTYSCLAWTTLDSVEKSAKLVVYGDQTVELCLLQKMNNLMSCVEYQGPEKGRPECKRRVKILVFRGLWRDCMMRYRHLPNLPLCFVAPQQNPTDVKGEGNETTNMIISWTPLPPREWHAASLRYHVQWRLENEAQWNETEVEGPPVVVTDTPVFSPFEIKVQARNDFGKGPEPLARRGYSGEDVPQAVPENILVVVINSTTVKLSWMLLNKEKVLGHLKGFWVRKNIRSRRQTHLHSHSHGQLLIEGNVSEVTLGGFRPWSQYRVQMSVLNGRGEGPRSEAITFNTPEGVPSLPESFHLDYLSETELILEWKPPKFPNGKLLKYMLTYQQGESTEVGLISSNIVIPSDQLTLNLSNLDPYTPYKFYLWAETKEGAGDPFVLEEHAMRESGKTCPGCQKVPLGGWQAWPSLAALNALHVLPSTEPEHQSSFAKESWFIGFVSAIVLLILVLVLLCFIKRSKGGKYSVKDKEDTQVDSEARPMKDETFGEYSDNEEKPFTSSQPSLNGDIKALGSDDSLADYGGSVDVQFNEDGSFIGQYSGQKGKEGGGNDSSGATSPTNVVTALE
uniref:L1 cell adhesion molecule n=1 Tax=Varanus komodoensis TaxID=61221 RepID=A0A8D2LZ48_VARKO